MIDLSQVHDAYAAKFKEFGPTAEGMFWNGEASQKARFKVILEVIQSRTTAPLSLGDFGCGNAALYAYAKDALSSYVGVDTNLEVLAWAVTNTPPISCSFDVSIAKQVDVWAVSGTYNYYGQLSRLEWVQWVQSTLRQMMEYSRIGVVANFLNADQCDWQKAGLFYPTVGEIAELVRPFSSGKLEVLYAPPEAMLREFTVFIPK